MGPDTATAMGGDGTREVTLALRSDAATAPRLGAWLLVAALPVGLPFAIVFTTYVMGEGADPWAGPFLLFGLAWVVFGRYLRSTDRTGARSTEVTSD